MGGGAAAKAAPTLTDAFIVTVQVDDVPLQAPLQPEKVNPCEGAAAKVMLLPLLKVLLQLEAQELPSEKPTPPVPVMLRFNVRVTTAAENVADTVLAASIVTEQVDELPLQAPLHPVKVKPDAGVAVSVTTLPLLKVLLQLEAQELPSEKPTPPVPAMARLNVRVTTAAENVADTFLTASMVTAQVVEVPLQAPLHPVKVEPAAGVAVSVTALPLLKVLLQLEVQELPSGKRTLPVPAMERFKPSVVGVVAVGFM